MGKKKQVTGSAKRMPRGDNEGKNRFYNIRGRLVYPSEPLCTFIMRTMFS